MYIPPPVFCLLSGVKSGKREEGKPNENYFKLSLGRQDLSDNSYLKNKYVYIFINGSRKYSSYTLIFYLLCYPSEPLRMFCAHTQPQTNTLWRIIQCYKMLLVCIMLQLDLWCREIWTRFTARIWCPGWSILYLTWRSTIFLVVMMIFCEKRRNNFAFIILKTQAGFILGFRNKLCW